MESGALLFTLVQIGASLVLLFLGGEALVRGSSALALRLGLTPLVIGLTVVAFGTSMPELVVSLQAAFQAQPEIAVGNVVGSNIANIALILGLTAIVRPTQIEARLVRLDAPLLVGVSLLLLVLLADASVVRWEGALLVLGLVAYTVFTFRQARQESPAVQEEFEHAGTPLGAEAPAPASVARGVVLVGIGLAMLVGGGRLLVDAAVGLALSMGASAVVVGLTVVAVGTSLPELATSLVAAVRGQGDIAVGNVVGSNLFNALGILGATALIMPLPGGVSWVDLGVMFGLAVVLLPLLYTRMRLSRLEGAFLLACYVAYTSWLVAG